jgi:hypothetical protein
MEIVIYQAEDDSNMDENGGFTPIDGHYNGKMVIFAAGIGIPCRQTQMGAFFEPVVVLAGYLRLAMTGTGCYIRGTIPHGEFPQIRQSFRAGKPIIVVHLRLSQNW